MLFYVSACFLLSAGCAERIVQFMSMAHTSKINHKILIVAHKSSSQHGKSIKRKSKKYAASPKKKRPASFKFSTLHFFTKSPAHSTVNDNKRLCQDKLNFLGFIIFHKWHKRHLPCTLIVNLSLSLSFSFRLLLSIVLSLVIILLYKLNSF